LLPLLLLLFLKEAFDGSLARLFVLPFLFSFGRLGEEGRDLLLDRLRTPLMGRSGCG